MKEAYNLYEREPKINSTVMRISVLEDRMILKKYFAYMKKELI